MKCTCAEAAKMLRKMNEDLGVLRSKEAKSYRFTAAVDEDIESARPIYHYKEAQAEQEELERKIRIIKHAINRFNLETVVPEFGMTIDELLVYIPQLSERKRKLTRMASFLPKERENGASYGSKIIEYTYTNYELKDAEEDLNKVSDALALAQTALDTINNQMTIEFEL